MCGSLAKLSPITTGLEKSLTAPLHHSVVAEINLFFLQPQPSCDGVETKMQQLNFNNKMQLAKRGEYQFVTQWQIHLQFTSD